LTAALAVLSGMLVMMKTEKMLWVERSEPVEVPLPSTAEGFFASPQTYEGFSTPPVLATLIIRSKNSPLSLFGDDHDAFQMPFLRTDVRSSHNRQMMVANQEKHTCNLTRIQYVFDTPAKQISSLSSPPTHWLEYDHLLEVVQRLDSRLGRELILIYSFPVRSISGSYYQILIAHRFRVESRKGSRNEMI
jgi:hypothetical protein